MTKCQNQLNDSFIDQNRYIFRKYKPIKKIGEGNFGNIYSTIRLKDKNVFAMKTEKRNMIIETLESEAYFLFILQGFGIPKLITYGHTKKYNILIETLFDKSLYNIYIKNKKVCNIIDTCLIGIQIIDRLEWIHSKNIIYRDIKPEHFLIGINDPNIIYIVDFGLCKKYRSSKTGKHILPKLTYKFNGNILYASPNAIKGKESSRRDDLISLGYMLVYLFKRKLPWKYDFNILNKTKYFETVNLKDTDGNGELFKEIPSEFIEFIKYTKNLKFEQDPDYSYLRSLFIKILNNKNLNYRNLPFSWINSKNDKLSCFPKNNSVRKSSPHIRIIKKLKEEQIKKLRSETLNNLKVDLKKIPIVNKIYPISKRQNNILVHKSNMNNNNTLNRYEYNSLLLKKNKFRNFKNNGAVGKTNYNLEKNNLSSVKSDNNIKGNIIKFNTYSMNNSDNNFIFMSKNLKKNKNKININNITNNNGITPIMINKKKIRFNNNISSYTPKDKKIIKSIRLNKTKILHRKNITFPHKLNSELDYNISNDIMTKCIKYNKSNNNLSNKKVIINNNLNIINNIY